MKETKFETNELWEFDFSKKEWLKIHGAHRPDDPLERDSPITALRSAKGRKKTHESSFANAPKGVPGEKIPSPSKFMLYKSESARDIRKAKKGKMGDEEKFWNITVAEPSSPVTAAMTNSIVLKSVAKNSIKGIYKGPVQKEEGEIEARIPCARDGHAGFLYKDRMYIFGGDRHQMSYNDLYFYPLE